MSNMKNFFWDEFYEEIDEPRWFKASGTKATDGKQGDTRNSGKVDKQSGNECDCCDDRPTAESIANSTDTKTEKPLSSVSDDFFYAVLDTSAEATNVLLEKHEDYGPSNIADAPGGAINGLAVRLHDKVARLSHLTKTGNDPKHESLYDTFLDISNYGLIGMLVLKDKWDTGD